MDGWSRDMDSLSDAMVPLDKNGFTAKNQMMVIMNEGTEESSNARGETEPKDELHCSSNTLENPEGNNAPRQLEKNLPENLENLDNYKEKAETFPIIQSQSFVASPNPASVPIKTIPIAEIGLTQLSGVQLPVIHPTPAVGQFQVLQPQGVPRIGLPKTVIGGQVFSTVNQVTRAGSSVPISGWPIPTVGISPTVAVPTSQLVGRKTLALNSQQVLGSTPVGSGSPHVLGNTPGVLASQQLVIGRTVGGPPGHLLAGKTGGVTAGQLLVGNTGAETAGQLALGVPAAQLVVGKTSVVTAGQLVVGNTAVTAGQLTVNSSSGIPGSKLGAPVQVPMALPIVSTTIDTTKGVQLPLVMTGSTTVNNQMLVIPPSVLQIQQNTLSSVQGQRKSIVLKKPISTPHLPISGQIIGKIPPGVIRMSALKKPNQVFHVQPDPQPVASEGNTFKVKNEVVTVTDSLRVSDQHKIQSEIKEADNLSQLTVDESSSPTELSINDAFQDSEQESKPSNTDEEGPSNRQPVARQLDLDESQDISDMSLECDEEFDDRFEKKENEKEENDDDSVEELNNDDEEPSDEEEEHKAKTNNGSNGGIDTVDLLKPLPGTIPGAAKVEVKTNEFGIMEVVDPKIMQLSRKVEELSKPTNLLHSPNSRKESMARRIQDDEILYCEGCGCYGMAGEFVAQNSCSNTCNNLIQSRSRDKQRRERELQVIRIRRDEKRVPQQKGKRKGLPALSTEEEMNNWKSSQYNTVYAWQDPKKGFIWSKYLEYCGARAAPVRLFPGEPFPDPHAFREGMKLEAIDPLHQSVICVVSIAEVQGPRLRLHFDGYSDSHDFWENADSENLFPATWCSRNHQKLTPPKGYGKTVYCWDTYLRITKSIAAPEELFLGRSRAAVGADSAVHGWKIGMKLEACDRQNKSLVCVATVGNVMEGRILLHFDGWEIDYDYWTKPSSMNVKPVGWCAANRKQLNPPKGNHPSAFSWPEYLNLTKSKPVPAWAFRSPGSSRDETDFQEGFRLETVDIYNPKILRVSSIAAVEGRQFEVHYDGWPDEMNHWVDDDSTDIHPCGWAAKTGHPLMPPLTPQEVKHWRERGSCETPGCRGIGHIKGSRYIGHHSVTACPYSPQNLEINSHVSDRLQGTDRERSEEYRLQLIKGESGEALGRGNRRRKKRKFFDEENPEGEPEEKRSDEDGRRLDEEGRSVSRLSDRSNSPTDTIRVNTAGSITRRAKRSTSTENSQHSSRSSDEFKDELDIKEEPLDPLQEDTNLLPTKKELISVGIQTEEQPSPSPPPFYQEWSEGVRRSVWQPGYLPQPEPTGTLAANWFEHSKILLGGRTENSKLTYNKAKHWNINQVVEFLNCIPNLDYEELEEAVREQELDGESLLMLTQNDITQLLGIKLGPAIKIYNAIMAVRMRRE